MNCKKEYHSSSLFDFEDFSKPDILIDEILSKIFDLAKNVDFSSFSLGVSWPDLDEESLLELRNSLQCKVIEQIKLKFSKEVDFSAPQARFLVDFKKKTVFLSLLQVFLKGNYCKFSRELAQTEHFCRCCRGKGCSKCGETGHSTSESIEQLLASIILPEFGASQIKFHGGGREDVDVLMLGKGRPFVVELIQPSKREVDLEKIEKKINEKFGGKISVNGLKIVEKGEVVLVKNSLHEKIYLAIVSCSKKPNLKKLKLNKKLNVEQRTPKRVEKRRVDLVRKKEVTLLETKSLGENEFEIKLKTSHGTYVKEFISGDDERSVPSISSLLETKCVCKQLDVLEIC